MSYLNHLQMMNKKTDLEGLRTNLWNSIKIDAVLPSAYSTSLLIIGSELLGDHDHPCTDLLGYFMVGLGLLELSMEVVVTISHFFINWILYRSLASPASLRILTLLFFLVKSLWISQLVVIFSAGLLVLPIMDRIGTPNCPSESILDAFLFTGTMMGLIWVMGLVSACCIAIINYERMSLAVREKIAN